MYPFDINNYRFEKIFIYYKNIKEEGTLIVIIIIIRALSVILPVAVRLERLINTETKEY